VKDGKKTVTEYYHRAVVAHLIGFDLPIVLDLEMLRPGEGEITAARRLLERLLKRYGRFFDAVQGDAIYFEAPLFHLCRKHGKHLLAVLKEDNPALLADAKALLQGPPDLVAEEKRNAKRIRFWDLEGFATDAIPERAIRVLRAEETTAKRERIAGQWAQTQQTSEWFWATSVPQSLLPSRQLAQVGHERWKIENSIFNALSTHWAMDHCFHHHPAAILNFLLILFIAHILLACFQRFNMKPPRRQRYALIALAAQILLGIQSLAAKDCPRTAAPGHPPPRA